MKVTPFYDIHRALGAKIVPFAGYAMPLQYTSIIEEHLAVRTRVGVFDVSHMGEIEISGTNALFFLDYITVNDVKKLYTGRIHYSVMCNERGGIIDDLLIYKLDDNRYMLVVNAANRQKDFDWLKKHAFAGVAIDDKSDEIALLAIQGPFSLNVLQKLTDVDLSSVQYYHFVRSNVVGIPMIISRTGYTGEIGFELYFDATTQNADTLWKALFEVGREYGITAAGLGARDSLRLEMGYCLYGNDIDETTNPLEAGLEWITKFTKKDFIGKQTLVQCKERGLEKKLIAFTVPDKRIARKGYSIEQNGSIVGNVTSGAYSPMLYKGIGMGFVKTQSLKNVPSLQVDIRGSKIPITLSQLPFIQK